MIQFGCQYLCYLSEYNIGARHLAAFHSLLQATEVPHHPHHTGQGGQLVPRLEHLQLWECNINFIVILRDRNSRSCPALVGAFTLPLPPLLTCLCCSGLAFFPPLVSIVELAYLKFINILGELITNSF